MKMITLHERYSNLPVCVKADTITAVQKRIVDNEEYSTIFTVHLGIDVKESLGDVLRKIYKADKESE